MFLMVSARALYVNYTHSRNCLDTFTYFGMIFILFFTTIYLLIILLVYVTSMLVDNGNSTYFFVLNYQKMNF